MTVQLDEEGIAALFADRDGPVGHIMEHKAFNVEAAMKELLLLPGSGRTYMPGVLTFRRGGKIYSNFSTGGRAAPHTASAPGEPPASDTGFLMSSIRHVIAVDETVYASIGSDLEYALYLELGTRYMEPRPFMRPALDIGLAQ